MLKTLTISLFLSLFSVLSLFAGNGNKTNVNHDSSFVCAPLVTEKLPVFPGGMEALFQYISNEVEYPKQALRKKIEGTVYVNFLVDQSGKINHVRLLKGIGYGCDEEAIHIIKHMPDWIPGMQNEKEVSVSLNLPIRFSILNKAEN